MTSRIEKLHPASFRGIRFLTPEDVTDRGQKVAVHEYPNSKTRYVESLGLIPPIFNMTCIVHSTSGDDGFGKTKADYFDKRARFEAVLETPGVAELVHPVYGSVQVHPGPFTVSANQTEVGSFVFDVVFYTSDEEVLPKEFPVTGANVSASADQARIASGYALEVAYNAPTTTNVFEDAINSMNSVMNDIQNGINKVVGPLQDGIARMNAAIDSIRSNVANIMRTATGVRNSLENAYNNLKQITEDFETIGYAWDELMDFDIRDLGKSDYDAEEEQQTANTTYEQQSSSNDEALNEHKKMNGLIGSFESAANTNFTTDESMNAAIAKIDAAFNEYMDVNPGVIALDPDFRAAMAKLRIDAKLALDAKANTVFKIKYINTIEKSSMSLLSYQYYGSLDDAKIIDDLNPKANPANFSGEVKIITK